MDIDPRIIQLIMDLRRRGIKNTDVLSAIERTPRHIFLPLSLQDSAYEDMALPIGEEQTISQPYIVAYMTEKLNLDNRCLLLEVGTGSGYQAAILSRLVRRVFTIERVAGFIEDAEKRFAALGLTNITTMVGDGSKGWPGDKTFDRIIVTAAARTAPEKLLNQLKIGGLMIAPIGEGGVEHLVLYKRTEEGFEEETLIPVRFVPLIEGREA